MDVQSIQKTSGAPTPRSMATSLGIHVLVIIVLALIPAQMLLQSQPPDKELDIVFYKPPELAVKPRVSLPVAKGTTGPGGSPPGAPAPALKPKPNAAPGPDKPGPSELPPGPAMGFPTDPTPASKVGKTAGILAFKDKIASLAQDTVAVPIGDNARHIAADDIG